MKIGFLGDLILSDEFQIDDYLLQKLNQTNFNVANLEASFANINKNRIGKMKRLHHLTDSCDLLKRLNIKAVSLANNHSFDQGNEGFCKTVQKLSKAKIEYFGAGENRKSASQLLEIEIDGVIIAIGGFVSDYLVKRIAHSNHSGVAPFKISLINNQLERSEADIKILYNHWNTEFELYPEPYYKSAGDELIKNCNVIIGSHSHTIQGYSQCENGLIFHSIGNFSIPHKGYNDGDLGVYPDYCYESFFVILNIEKTKNDFKFSPEIVPYHISKDGLSLSKMNEREEHAFISKIAAYSEPLALKTKQYTQFYKTNRIRKSRPVLIENNSLNKTRLFIYYTLKSIIISSSIFFAKVLTYIGLREFIRKRLSFIIDKIFKI